MFEKTIVVLIGLAAVFLGDMDRYRQMRPKAGIGYGLLLASALYLSLIFMFDLPWPNLTDVLRTAYGWAAMRWVDWLKN
ncbi:hypothetical protein ACF3MZ_08995 [Paenibacillaceae bacterium WGS1546]|uniref:hypothetical protein n=1 Tax=Cohnella sp. WGS1546 TaxID=3366810 RepID=UPI00372D7A03